MRRERLREYADIEKELISLLEDLRKTVPSNAASVEVRPANGGGILAILKPTNPAAASVTAHAENGFSQIDVSFGKHVPTWELPFFGRSPNPGKKELLQEVEQFCRAVIAGHCEHTRGVLSVVGKIDIGGESYKVRHFFYLRTNPRLRGTQKYDPYVSDDNTALQSR